MSCADGSSYGMDDNSEVEIEYEDSSDAFESDGDVGGAFGDVPTTVLSQGEDKDHVEILTVDELRAKYHADVGAIQETLGLSEANAWRALRHSGWDVLRCTSRWFEDPEACQRSIGIAPSAEIVSVDEAAEKECPVCFRTFRTADMLGPGCGHHACKDCWQGYLRAYIDDATAVTRLACPEVDCRVVAPIPLLLKVATPAQQERLAEYEARLVVDSNPHASWCRRPNCAHVSRAIGRLPKHPEPLDVHCACGETYCFTCKEEAHRPVDCATVKAWSVKNSAESENLTWIMANTKACPKCQAHIEKNHGCMHMTCSRCRHEFCWLCMTAWSQHGDNTGGYYACNKYETGKRKGEFSEEERKRKQAKDSIDRYHHYYERFHAHHAARAKAQKELETGRCAADVERMSAAVKVSETQLRFMREAHEQIVECRRMLKWTYAFGYYQFDTAALPDEADVPAAEAAAAAAERRRLAERKDFFEFLQCDAETSLELLSKAVEQDCRPFYGRAELLRTAKLKPGGEARAEELSEDEFVMEEFGRLQLSVTTLTQNSKKMFERFVTQLEAGLEGMAEQYGTSRSGEMS